MKFRLLLLALFTSSLSFSQVTNQLVVEHFTNTNCPICGSRNPGLFTNLDNNNTDVLHISYYPSRPYSDCKLHLDNPSENDDRTRFYGLYGSTPQIAIQGEAQSRPNFNNASLFDSYRGGSQPYTLTTKYETTKDSIIVEVVLAAQGISNIDVKLYTIVVEDTVFYRGRNSEGEHYNVFRKALTDIEGDPIKTALIVGDSLVYRYSVALKSSWDADRMYALAMVQDPMTKEVYQASKGKEDKLVIVSTPSALESQNVQVYPSYVNRFVQVSGLEQGTFEVFNLQGQQLLQGNINGRIDLATLPKGMYLIQLSNGEQTLSRKVIKQ